jgi:hypothetical protein
MLNILSYNTKKLINLVSAINTVLHGICIFFRDAAAVWRNGHGTASGSQEGKIPCLNTTVT